MSKKSRRDNQGHVLRSGESQRQNGSYCYRYAAGNGQRQTVYAPTLDELRLKEQSITRFVALGGDLSRRHMTVLEILQQYLETRRNLRPNTIKTYQSVVNKIKADPLGAIEIAQVRPSDAKRWIVALHDQGKKRKTIWMSHQLLRAALQMAVDDDMLLKNPFAFSVESLIAYDSQERLPLSPQEQRELLEVSSKFGRNSCYNDIVVLLDTGLRISELYGLTIHDVDLQKKRLSVSRQMVVLSSGKRSIGTPKTQSGIRTIPLTDRACAALREEIEKHKNVKVEPVVNGVCGFVFLSARGKPKTPEVIYDAIAAVKQKYEQETGQPFMRVSPHILRHTFCTNMQTAGLDVKSLQYLMGHASVNMALNLYSHATEESACCAFEAIAGSQ